MQSEKGRSAGSRRVTLSVNVSSSIPSSASPPSSFPGLHARHSALLPVAVVCNRTKTLQVFVARAA